MDFFSVVSNRHSVRKYESRDVEEEKLDRILETINLAPSAGNLQGYEIIVVRDQVTKNALDEASYGQEYVGCAPVVLVFCANHLMSGSKYGQRGENLYAVQDATIAATFCQLAATALGLATVWVGAFNPQAAAEALQVPDRVSPVAIIPIGYPAEEPIRTPRRHLSDLVRREKY